MDRTGRYCSSSSTDFHKVLVSVTQKKKTILNLKMLKFTCLLLIVALMLQVSQAWDEGYNNEEEQLAAARQQSDEYFANAFGYTSNPWDSAYYQPSAPGK